MTDQLQRRITRQQIEVLEDANLPQAWRGYWDPDTRTIVLAPGLTPGQRRATLAHELVHAERGDVHRRDVWASLEMENEVEQVAATILLPIDELADGLLAGESEREVADMLEVDLSMLRTRVANMTPAERSYIEARRARAAAGAAA